MKSNDPKLLILFNKVNAKYFENEIKIYGIYWKKPKDLFKLNGEIVLANWLDKNKGILLNDILRKLKAPNYEIEYLIFHECLHQERYYHCVTFRLKENRFPLLQKAINWQKKHKKIINAAIN